MTKANHKIVLLIKKLCDKVVWIEHGEVQDIGGKEVCDKYIKAMKGN